jgi:CubicO group peptidase (beta-lactamase class C family)
MAKCFLLAAVAMALAVPSAAAEPVPDLSGLWTAKLRYGPDIEGPLLIYRTNIGWIADIAGFQVPADVRGSTVAFSLPDDRGSFRGRIEGGTLRGDWVQNKSATGGTPYATRIELSQDRFGRWSGAVDPMKSAATYFLPLVRSGSSYATFLDNPERNVGRFIPIRRVEVEGDAVRAFGSRDGQPEKLLASGRVDSEQGTFSLSIGGDSADFSPDRSSSSTFYARGNPPQRYHYQIPLQLGDGWPVASLASAGISTPLIERFVQKLIDTRPAPGVPQIDSLLIARHGKLVLEEYFHGYSRDTAHDVRSAGKSMTGMMIGAAMLNGVPIREDTPVYATMLGKAPPDLDPRKRAMTLRDLMTMTSGYFCDDNNSDAPGNEDNIQAQTEYPDYYSYILKLPMASAPGDKIVYCSANAILAGGVLRKVTGEPLTDLFDRWVARPLQMGSYHVNLTPAGELYTAGGGHFLPRDFMKLAQVMLNGGTWRGKRIVSRDWVRKSGAPLHVLSPEQQYGYFWNTAELKWKGRTVHAVFAAGNGSQIFLEIPELDLVVAFTGANYGDRSALIPERVMLPEDILPAVQ